MALVMTLACLYFVVGFGLVGMILLPRLLVPRLQSEFPRKGRRLYQAHDYAVALVSKRAAKKIFNATPHRLRALLPPSAYWLSLIYLSAWYSFYLILIPLFSYTYWKMIY